MNINVAIRSFKASSCILF